MNYAQLIKFYRTVQNAADSLFYSRQAIYRWRDYGIPKRAQQQIEVETRGLLKAERRRNGK